MIDAFQRPRCSTRLQIPLIYGEDSVHGDNNLVGATVFPHNIGLGATRDPALVEKDGQITATETRATGVPWAFSPCVCVTRDERWGRSYESFGEDPALVDAMETTIDGLQGNGGRTSRSTSVLATAKHFVGDGGTAYGSSTTGDYTIDQGVTVTRPSRIGAVRPRPVPAGRAEARRRLGHAVVLEPAMHRRRTRQPDQDARPWRDDHRRAEGPARLQRLRDQRLAGHQPDPASPDHETDRSRSASTPASTW